MRVVTAILAIAALLVIAYCAARAEEVNPQVKLQFVACSEERCHIETVPGTMPGTYCMAVAQQVIAAWFAEHPKYSFSGLWRCVRPELAQTEL